MHDGTILAVADTVNLVWAPNISGHAELERFLLAIDAILLSAVEFEDGAVVIWVTF